MRRQSEQVARAVAEQARAARDMTTAAQSISKEIGLITRSNRQHVTSAEQVLGTLTDIRRITERNARGVEATLGGTANLIARAQQLAELVGDAGAEGRGENGAGGPAPSGARANGRSRRPKKSPGSDEVFAAGGPEPPDGSGR
jgi:hypothetical protein